MSEQTVKYLPSHLANYFLWRADEDNIVDMTPMKLIKLVYFSYAWNLVVFNEKLFDEKIEAWRYGPVVPSIYHEFKSFGNSQIKKYAISSKIDTGEISYPIVDKKDSAILGVLLAIWNVYKASSGATLSSITHEESSPWRSAYDQGENTILDDQHICDRAKVAIMKYFPKTILY